MSLVLVLLSPVTGLADDPVFTTFVQVKTEYKAKHYTRADAALRHLAELLAAPEFAALRPRVLPAYHFYTAVVAWELKDEERAKTALNEYFTLQPGAELDRGAYPKKFARLFADEKEKFDESEAANTPVDPAASAGILSDYGTFPANLSAIPQYSGTPDWVESPVRFILTSKEKRRFKSLGDDEARREWVAAFWRGLDQDPSTPENEFQEEFYRRAQYADAKFSTEQTRGSLSDRGMVFIILGAPTFSARDVLKGNDDPVGAARHVTKIGDPNTGQVLEVTAGQGTANVRGQQNQVKAPSISGGYVPGTDDGIVELWIYRGARIPQGIPYQELNFKFMTRAGYGDAVLQKDPRQLTAIGRVVSLLRADHSGS